MLNKLSKLLFWRGLLAVAVGVVAVVWPGITLAAVVAIFAIAVFIGAVDQCARAFSSAKAGSVAGHLLLALLDIAAGAVALAWPGLTVEALTIWIGVWAIVSGGLEFGVMFTARAMAGERALHGFGGLLAVVLGVVLLAHPALGAVSLAEVFGLYSLGLGTWSLVLAGSTRATGARIDRALGSHA
jgi:uncharacterized membrane protein HdeD (DUF308 family)